jgi:hypothetical protein
MGQVRQGKIFDHYSKMKEGRDYPAQIQPQKDPVSHALIYRSIFLLATPTKMSSISTKVSSFISQ